MGMMDAEDLCNQHHGYDTGIFDSIVRSLLAGFGVSDGVHREAEPVDNFLAVAVIWFLVGVSLVLLIGVILLLVLEKVSGGEEEEEEDYFYDEEKQVPPCDEV